MLLGTSEVTGVTELKTYLYGFRHFIQQCKALNNDSYEIG